MDNLNLTLQTAIQHIQNARANLATKIEGSIATQSIENGIGAYVADPLFKPFTTITAPPLGFLTVEHLEEVQRINDREADFLSILNNPNSYQVLNNANYLDLLNIRAQYNLGNGDPMELFSAYMPNRAALSGQDLIDYDIQFNRILQHMNSMTVLDDGLTSDPSLKFILAASLAEVMAHNPSLVSQILADINQGWFISMDGSHFDDPSHIGLYSHSWKYGIFDWELTNKYYANIQFSLGHVFDSFVNPDDQLDIMAHEVAHSLDRYNRTGPDGIPTGMHPNDVTRLAAVRTEMNAVFAADPMNSSGLRPYAYENDQEFWAVASAFFLGGFDSAQEIFNNSPDLYIILANYYQISYPVRGVSNPPIVI